MKLKTPTTTYLVLNALREADDFMNRAMLQRVTARNDNQISAALYHMRKMRCVDVIVSPDGVGWWYALPPESDCRCWSHSETAPHSSPQKPRRYRHKRVLKQLTKAGEA